MTSDDHDQTIPAVPPVPVGLEDLVGMAAASPDFAEALLARRSEAVTASGVDLAPTERLVLEAVNDATLSRLVETCRAQQASEARRAFLAKASAAMVLLVGAGAAVAAGGCEKKTTGGARQPGASPGPDGGAGSAPAPRPEMDPPAMRQADTAQRDAGSPRARPVPQVTAGVRPPRPRPMRPSGVKTGISPGHRRRQKLDVETGSRPD